MNLKWLILLNLCFSVVYAEPALLQQKDVKKIMGEIFQQHVSKKQMTPQIYKESVEYFIEGADPDKIYLLQSEVMPYLNLSDSTLQEKVVQYNKGNYTFFDEINQTIQKSYLRAREFRVQEEMSTPRVIKEAMEGDAPILYNTDKWAISIADLKSRQEQNFKTFVIQWVHRYGKARATSNPQEIAKRYDQDQRTKENPYLYILSNNSPLSAPEAENLFSLHILKAIAATLDSHTKIYDPSEAQSMRMRLEKSFQGVGIVLDHGTGKGLRIKKIVEGSPAAKSGLVKTDDELTEVNGTSLEGLDFQDALAVVRNQTGEMMAMTLLRGDSSNQKTIQVDLKKEQLDVGGDRLQILSEKFGQGILGVISLDSFYQSDSGISSEKDIKDALGRLEKGNLRGLVLDLRTNRGGFLTQAVKVAGLFITNGVVVVSKYSSGEEKIYRDTDGKTSYTGPLVVLVSKMTASAAEIVAQALQDYGVAVIVGDEHTYGKGTIQSQTVTDSPGSSSYFKVTVGKYYTVSGKTPQIQGVRSDIVVPGPYANREIGEAYLKDTLPSDRISPIFRDQLADVDPNLKAWYLKYYMPTLQVEQGEWRGYTNTLKEKSHYRLENNLDYQTFIKDQAEEFPPGRDLQLIEALNILKDMIYLESKQSRAKSLELN